MASAHAKLSPSSAERWMACPGSVALSEGIEDEGSKYAHEGTAAHELAELVLTSGVADANEYVGRTAGNGVEFTDDMAEHVMTYVNRIRDYAKGNTLLVEQKLSIEHITGEEGAVGTSDAVIVAGDELQVHDLKYGQGVRVIADDNKQLKIYALAALREFDVLGDFKRVRLVIHQPRLNHVSEWDISIKDLILFQEGAKAIAGQCFRAVKIKPALDPKVWSDTYLKPTIDGCQWCKAKAICPALRDYVMETVTGEEFPDYTEVDVVAEVEKGTKRAIADNTLLAKLLSAVDMIEHWCSAIRGKANEELQHGNEVPGFKLVQGRKGARAWSDDKAAEEIMKSMRLKADEMYKFKLISPTEAEKVLADTPKRWARISPLITQSEGGLSVVPVSDKRPAVVVQVESFENEEAEGLV